MHAFFVPIVCRGADGVRRITWHVLIDPRPEAAAIIQRAYRRHRRNAKALAFAMGLHARLGSRSAVSAVDADLAAMIGRMI